MKPELEQIDLIYNRVVDVQAAMELLLRRCEYFLAHFDSPGFDIEGERETCLRDLRVAIGKLK